MIAGALGWKNAEIKTLIEQNPDTIFSLGYVPTRQLSELYNLADLFVYPSLYEGFGLPPLEAMACGCPVMVSKTASLPEVCGSAAFYINPLDGAGIAQGLDMLLQDTERLNLLKSKGLKQSQQFSWEKSADQHAALFKEVISG